MLIPKKISYFFTSTFFIFSTVIADIYLSETVQEKPLDIKPSTALDSADNKTDKTDKKIEKEWTFLVYMEADNNLNAFASSNLNDMMKIGSTENLNLLVQCNQNHNQGIWRYKVVKNKIELESSMPKNPNNDCVADLVDAMKWVHTNYPAKQYAIVLWNHGVGIIDPIWGFTSAFSAKRDDKDINPRATISGLDLNNIDDELRGILFNETTRTYMNNQQLTESLKQINQLLGKKLDLLGMDACLMAMVEVGYQIRKYVNVLVASQEVESAHGWFYSAFLSQLSSTAMDCNMLASSIVVSFELFYKNRAFGYTQSAINLNNIELLKTSIDQIVELIKQCKKTNNNKIKQMIFNARNSCLQFNTPSYIDLHSFFFELHKQINTSCTKSPDSLNDENLADNDDENSTIQTCYTILPENYYQENVTRIQNYSNNAIEDRRIKLTNVQNQKPSDIATKRTNLEKLKNALIIGMNLIEEIAFANACGKNLSRAKGISIYYPHNRIDNSYLKTDFALESSWINYLKDNI